VDQGGGKRKGSFAIYLEPWHADIFDFLDLKKPHGKDVSGGHRHHDDDAAFGRNEPAPPSSSSSLSPSSSSPS